MAFVESVRLRVLERAHFRCCMCQKVAGVQVHHINSQAQGGDDSEDNAAPLCPSCHVDFGDNPRKRKEIRQMRDWWYRLCESRDPPPHCIEMSAQLQNVASKEDLERLTERIVTEIRTISSQPQKPTPEVITDLTDFTGTLGSVPGAGFILCEHCGVRNFFRGSSIVRCTRCNRELGRVDISEPLGPP